MPRAQGARSQLTATFETTCGTAPTSGFMQMPFASASLGAEQPLLASELLGYGRDPLAPIKDAVTAEGGVTYGYDVVRTLQSDGTVVTGERRINEDQAEIVRRIFREFAEGHSPRAIAQRLNRESIPGPRSTWGPSTIYGNHKRGTGILNNELYIGRLVWNRQRFIKDPMTGRRQARLNPPEEWIVEDVPELRIIDQNLWDAVKRRRKRPARDDTIQLPTSEPAKDPTAPPIVRRPFYRLIVQARVVQMPLSVHHSPTVPAGMDHPKLREFQPQRQGFHPRNRVARGVAVNRMIVQKTRVLFEVLLAVRPQRQASRSMPCMEMDGIQFVISHDRLRLACADHGPHDLQHAGVIRSTVDEIAQKHDRAAGFRMTPAAARFTVPELAQKSGQLVRLPVDVGDDVPDHEKSLLIRKSVWPSIIHGPYYPETR